VTVLAAPAEAVWTAARIEELVIDLLAALLNEDRDHLRQRLLSEGEHMPVDSLDLFDILVEFRKRTGLRLPVRRLGRQTMRSVKLFAQFAEKEGTQ
jgi:acyl carrier protein